MPEVPSIPLVPEVPDVPSKPLVPEVPSPPAAPSKFTNPVPDPVPVELVTLTVIPPVKLS